jgi:excisionase family DNA binding protein
MSSAPFNILGALEQANGLLTVDDVAALFGLSKFTIYRMRAKQQIPSIAVGGSIRFDPSTLALWLTKKQPQIAVALRQIRSAA